MSIIAIPDCANTPEQLAGLEPGIPSESQVARRLAENRCNVLVPLLLNRESRLSRLGQRATDIPHREFVYRAAFELGRTLLGLEVQSLLAVKSWLHAKGLPTGVFGYGEEGALPFMLRLLQVIPQLSPGTFSRARRCGASRSIGICSESSIV